MYGNKEDLSLICRWRQQVNAPVENEARKGV